MNEIISYDAVPLFLNADDVANVLRISRAGAYTLMHSESFPTVYIGERRMVVPRDKLFEWINNQISA